MELIELPPNVVDLKIDMTPAQDYYLIPDVDRKVGFLEMLFVSSLTETQKTIWWFYHGTKFAEPKEPVNFVFVRAYKGE